MTWNAYLVQLLWISVLLRIVLSQNANLNKTIKILPEEASCHKSDIRFPEYLRLRYLKEFGGSTDLKLVCSHNPCNTSSSAKLIFSTSGSIFTGQNGCTFPPSKQYPDDSNDPSGSQFCFTDLDPPELSMPARTYLVKFRTDIKKARGYGCQNFISN